MGRKKVFIIHTSAVSMTELLRLFAELAPEVTVRNIMDDSLLPEVIENGGVTDAVAQRIAAYAKMAELAGADLIFTQCSSVGEAADKAAEGVVVPLVKIDERMAEVACETGRRIGVIATLMTTLGPTSRLVQRTAERMGKQIEIVERLCEGAFDKLIAGDRRGHNAMVLEGIHELAEQVDVVVCAQGSMMALLDELGETKVPVLTSPRLGVEKAVQVLRDRA
jgi:aspartate/glutamate racemase